MQGATTTRTDRDFNYQQKGGLATGPPREENVTVNQVNSTTPRLVFKGRCKGEDIARWFAILLRQYGNVRVAEVK